MTAGALTRSNSSHDPIAFISDFSNPLETKLMTLIRGRASFWKERLLSYQEVIKSLLSGWQAARDNSLKSNQILEQLEQSLIAKELEGWMEEAEGRLASISVASDQFDTLLKDFVGTSGRLADALEESSKAQDARQRELSKSIGDFIAFWRWWHQEEQRRREGNARVLFNSNYSFRLGNRAVLSGAPDPWFWQVRLERATTAFAEERCRIATVLETQFGELGSLEGRLRVGLGEVMRSLIGSAGSNLYGAFNVQTGWEEVLRASGLGDEPDLQTSLSLSAEALTATLQSLIQATLEEEKLQIPDGSSYTLLLNGTLRRATKGPRAWFATAYSQAAWSRATHLIVSSTGFLHLYDLERDSECPLVEQGERLFRPDYSLDLRKCEVKTVDEVHAILSITAIEDKKAGKELLLRCRSSDELEAWRLGLLEAACSHFTIEPQRKITPLSLTATPEQKTTQIELEPEVEEDPYELPPTNPIIADDNPWD